MATVIDHLRSDLRVRVLRGFRDERGTTVEPGDEGVIRRIELQWPGPRLVIEWERNGRREPLEFRLDAVDGPRNGHMRDYFEVAGVAPLSSPPREQARRHQNAVLPSVAIPVEPTCVSWHQLAEAKERLRALAAQHRFAEAEEQIRLLLAAPDAPERCLEVLAHEMLILAEAYLADPDTTQYRWWRERTIDLWYAWGSMATSGGEGSAMAVQIRAAERRLPEVG